MTERPDAVSAMVMARASGVRVEDLSQRDEFRDLSHDSLGRLISDGQTRYTYNAANQLTSQTTDAATSNYSYDGDGRRLSTTRGSSTGPATTNHLWDPLSHQLVAETDGAGTLLASYHRGLGTFGYRIPGQGDHTHHLDSQGSIRAVTGPDGALDGRTTHEPYGTIKSQNVIDAASTLSALGFAGQYTDPAGSLHLRARQYDPTTGTFNVPDPVASTSTSATYGYAANNPMVYGDPTGLYSFGEFMQDVNTVPVVAGVATVLTPTPLAPIAGPVAGIAGAATAVSGAYLAVDACTSGGKGACGPAIVNTALDTALGFAGGALAGLAIRKAGSHLAANGGSRVFWSGGDVAKNAAADYAKANGGKTLEMTLTGRALQRLPQGVVPRKAWDLASARFARGAKGYAHVFFGPGAPWPSSTFSRIEAPILHQLGNPIMQHFLEGP